MTRYYLLFVLMLITSSSFAQEFETESEEERNQTTMYHDEVLNIFLDCRWCDRTYIKKSIPYVNYVNNKDEADVHVFVRRRVTGGGGGEYTLDFIGQGEFAEMQESMMFFSPIDETADETRRARTNVIAMGLMKFVARTPESRNIRITYIDDEENGIREDIKRTGGNIADDPWNSWMFRLRGSGQFNKDENYETTRASTSLSADRVTPDLKAEFDLRYSYRQTKYASSGSKSYRENWSVRGLLVKSIGKQWSAGGRFSVSSDTYNNYKLATSMGPAIEYNFFPYEESFKRQFRVQYGLSGHYNDYNDTTTFFKTNEFLLRHYLSSSLGFNQPWGSGYLSMTWANYLHDFSQNNLGIRANIRYRIYKGLSISVETRANLIHDQRNLAKGNATEQEVLTRQRALKTSYSYSFELGLSYSFGSIYNNVVNPRFGN